MRRILSKEISKQLGLSIVELMVALVLGVLLSLGLVQIFSSNSQSFRINEAGARAQESGRIAADILSRALRNAGYFGCYPVNGIQNNLDATDGNYDDSLHNFRVEGITAEDTLRPATAVADTDFFMVSGVRNDGASVTTAAQVNAASFTVTERGSLQPGDVIMVSDCANGDIVEISNIQQGGSGTQVTLVANSGNGVPGNDFSGNSPAGCNNPNNCLSTIYAQGAQVMRPYNEIYYVAVGASGERALFMRDARGVPVELVEGVMDLQVRFGTGTAQIGVQSWEGAADVGDWSAVIAAQISLLVRAGQDNLLAEAQQYCYPGWLDCGGGAPILTAPDNRLYRVYTFTATLRNRI